MKKNVVRNCNDDLFSGSVFWCFSIKGIKNSVALEMIYTVLDIVQYAVVF